MSGPQDGQQESYPGPAVRIGRDPGMDLALSHDPEIPAAGITVWLENGVLSLRDEQGSRPLAPGALFRIGGTWIRVDGG